MDKHAVIMKRVWITKGDYDEICRKRFCEFEGQNALIMPISPPNPPFGDDDKIFNQTDDEGNIIGGPYSYNEFVQKLKDVSGVNEDLMGLK